MEDKMIKQIKTSCPFPLLIYRTNIKYNEVRKASGVSYILLELIETSKGSKEKISDVLLKFGIPTDLHYIFGRELAGLIGTEIIKSRYQAEHFNTPKYFSQIRVGEVALTDKGKKMFKEGAIPTGAEKTKVKDIYFDPVKRKFDVSFSQPYADILTTCLDEDFMASVDIDISGMGDYINANPTKMGLKAEERMVSFETEEPQWKGTRKDENLTINIRESGAEFLFETNNENVFFVKYYTSKIMKEVMLLKTKYKFYDSKKNPISVPSVRFEDLGASNLYIPDDIQKQAARPCKIYISRNSFGYERADSVIKTDEDTSKKLLDAVDKNAEFALLDNSGCRYYRAFNVAIPCEQLDDVFEMQLLVENQLSAEKFDEMINSIFNLYTEIPFNSESGKVIMFAVDVLHSPTLFEKYATAKLNEVKSADEKIGVLLKLNETLKKSAEWKPFFERFANEMYAESVKEIRLDNMIYKNTVLSPLASAIGMSKTDYIFSFSQDIRKDEEPTLVYQALSAAGFATIEILGVANVVEVYIRAVLENEEISTDNDLAAKFNTVRVNLWKLNDILGIDDFSVYTLKEDYNIDEFFGVYATFKSSFGAVEKYREYALKEYGELKRYTEIFEPIHDLLAIERTSSSHPDKITKKYIDEQLSRGKYKDAICDLLIKLQFDLRKLLQADNTVPANELIDEAKRRRYIDGKQADALHKLRMCRNSFQHPTDRQVQFDRITIETWRDIVFGFQHESSSEDDIQISDLGFCVDTFNVLKRGGIKTVSQILDHSKKELLKIRNLGKKNLDEIEEKLQLLGYKIND